MQLLLGKEKKKKTRFTYFMFVKFVFIFLFAILNRLLCFVNVFVAGQQLQEG